MNKVISYRDLEVWRQSRTLASTIYQLTHDFPASEQFGITNQMRRAAVSIPSNIAEGFGRSTAKEKNQFYYTAKGSLAELETQLYIACDVGYITDRMLQDTMDHASLTHRLLQGLIKANKERL
ncbi:MAG: four helix bundle protein [Candidatus Saccharimonadales bacterium]